MRPNLGTCRAAVDAISLVAMICELTLRLVVILVLVKEISKCGALNFHIAAVARDTLSR